MIIFLVLQNGRLYISIARWCNQPSFFKKMSLRQFGIANGIESACNRYLMDFENKYTEVAYFYDMRYDVITDTKKYEKYNEKIVEYF